MGAVLFVDLEDAGVLGVAGGENIRRLALQKNRSVGAAAVDHATDDDHGRRKARGGEIASGGAQSAKAGGRRRVAGAVCHVIRDKLHRRGAGAITGTLRRRGLAERTESREGR